MAKQAGPRFPHGLGRASRARHTGIPQAQRLLLHRMGVPQGPHAARKLRKPPQSFFLAKNAHRANCAPTFAEEVSAILRDAMRSAPIVSPARYENLDFGSEIDWHLDPVHASALRSIPGAKSLLLDFARSATTRSFGN